MSSRSIMMLVLAIIFSVTTSLGLYSLLSGKDGTNSKGRVVVAKVNLARGVMVTADQVELRSIDRSHIPSGAITRIEDSLERAVFIPLLEGESLVEAKLAAKGAGRGLAALIPKGMRAMTIHTASVSSGLAGFILPGNRVDVLLTIAGATVDDASGGGSTSTLLQNVEVLAVDQKVEAPVENKIDPKEMRSVTLIVNPDQAARLELGQSKGALQLTLRSLNDHDQATARSASLSDFRPVRKRSWDERLRGVFAEAKRVGTTTGRVKPRVGEAAALPFVVATPPPPTPLISTIRTIRGTMESSVKIEATPTETRTAARGLR